VQSEAIQGIFIFEMWIQNDLFFCDIFLCFSYISLPLLYIQDAVGSFSSLAVVASFQTSSKG